MSPPLQPAAAVQADPDYTDTEETGDEDLPAARPARPARPREGLPAAYRMRHASHYVEQLMGDAPIQTVRQISIDQIDRVSIKGEGTGLAGGDVLCGFSTGIHGEERAGTVSMAASHLAGRDLVFDSAGGGGLP